MAHSGMTAEEDTVVRALAAAWNLFVDLPKEHEDDADEFRAGIHRLQQAIMSRPIRRNITRK